MTNFDYAAAIRARPSGETTQQLIAVYGNPEGPGASASNQGGAWFNPSPAWVKANIVLIPLAELPGFPKCPYGVIKGVSLHKQVAPVFRATWADLVAAGLHTRLRTFDGSVAYRHMGHNRARPLSVHAFGAALDFDAAWNGYGIDPAKMQMDREIVRLMESRGWTWGGRWTGAFCDGMHWQWTDPLNGVRVADWQDAMARPVAPPPVPAGPAIPLGWEPLYTPEMKIIPGRWVSVVRNGDKFRVVDVPEYRVKQAGLL